MKYIKQIPETDKGLSEKLKLEGWTRLRGPNNLLQAILLSLPFMLINALISLAIIYFLDPSFKRSVNNLLNNPEIDIKISGSFVSLILYISIFIVFIIIHELLHALFIPNIFKSDRTSWGTNGISAFVYTREIIKKGRYLLITIMPFILLSMVLPLILKFLGFLTPFGIFLILINSLASSVDCLNTFIILFQVPKNSYLQSNGFETYFK